MSLQWSAAMISPAEDFAGAPLLRTEFALDDGHGAVMSAELAVSSLGVFEAYLNGRAVGHDVLSPGWSSYEWRLRYRTYDVTELVRAGHGPGYLPGQRLEPRAAGLEREPRLLR